MLSFLTIIVVSVNIIIQVNTKVSNNDFFWSISEDQKKSLLCQQSNVRIKTENLQMIRFTNATYTHGESPAWDADAGTVYWVDAFNQDVHSLHYGTLRHRVKHIEYGEVNAVVPVADSSRVLVCVRSEVFLLDWEKTGDSALRLVAALDIGKPDNQLNEGKADARGRLWTGSKGPQRGDKVKSHEGALYMLQAPCFTPQSLLKPVSISNGLTWALNNTVLFYTDSGTKKIEAFDFDLDRGSISNRRTILDITKYGYLKAIPDGMTIDKDGYLWVALMFEGAIIRIDPDARLIVENYKLPVSRTTSVAWVGHDLDTLVVTTSRRNMDRGELAKEPLSGSIFLMSNLGTTGVPDHKVLFDGADDY